MVFFTLYSLVLAAAPGPVLEGSAHSRYVRTAAADSESILTTEALAKMTKFWAAYTKEPDSVKTAARKAHQRDIDVPLSNGGVKKIGDVDIVAMAAAYPSVATDLKAAGLTAQQLEADRLALFAAVLGRQAPDSAKPANTSVTGRNVAFLNAHATEFHALRAVGMPYPRQLMHAVPYSIGQMLRQRMGNP